MLELPRITKRSLSSAVLISAIAAGAVLCALVAWPFLAAIVWSLTLAVLFGPLNEAIRRRVRSPGLAAAATVTLTAGIAVVPTILVIGTLLTEAVRSAAVIGPMLEKENLKEALSAHAWIAQALQWIEDRINLREVMQGLTTTFTNWSGSIVRASFTGVLNLLLTFFFLFYLLRDRETIKNAVRLRSPLSDAEFSRVAERVTNTIFATVIGTLSVAALQGSLGGVMFWWLGLPAPVFWGVLMAILAIVPFLGAFVIWAPTAAFLALTGSYQSAVVLAVWGTVVIGLVDNVIYPMLVGNKLGMHTMLSFIAVVGGLFALGTTGIVLGPLLVTITLTLVDIWRARSAEAADAA
ncbi:MAG: AI-2E family transporter [Bradyrhizobium sp.]|uniref:AI-2E family transporter n=1 Tax=Bradyrhizobium sp. TaxID=376 RepID=UPI0025BE01D1|nr:AI-2E family transporter [Bradyrhizobium sp.]MBI5264243.1 AI-2E family transporter [Bradyrhizobium sp.]